MKYALRGIEGVDGREPVGAVLRVGVKPAGRAAPKDRDRFFVCHPYQDGNKIRPLHEAFASFNAAKPEHRRSVEAVLVHATEEEAFHYGLSAWRLPDQQAPAHGPACQGDGIVAIRRVGQEEPVEIPCPNRTCAYRQGAKPACKPLMRVLFRPVWPGGRLPTPLMRFESHSWNSVEAWVGMFRHIREQAQHLGIESPSLYGFKFRISLQEKTSAAKGTRFPVVIPSPEVDVQSFLVAQGQLRQQLGASQPIGMLDAGEHDPEELEVVEAELAGAPAGGG